MLVLGLFLGVLVGIAFMKAFSAASAADRFDDPVFIGATEERIRPVGRVALIGDVQAWAPLLAQSFEVLSERETVARAP